MGLGHTQTRRDINTRRLGWYYFTGGCWGGGAGPYQHIAVCLSIIIIAVTHGYLQQASFKKARSQPELQLFVVDPKGKLSPISSDLFFPRLDRSAAHQKF